MTSVGKADHENAASVDIALDPDLTLYPLTPAQRSAVDALRDETRRSVAAGAHVRWIAPLSAAFIYRLEGVFSEARALGAEPCIGGGDVSSLSPNDRLFLDDFLRYRVLGEDAALLSGEDRRHYEQLLGRLGSPPVTNISFAADAAEVLLHGVRGHLAAFGASAGDARKVAGARYAKVLLIGAYGGEHIGDAAILGGVLFRINRKHGVSNAVLMTQRPAHTRHLTPMIETPVTIDVREYLHREIDAVIDSVDAVVFAGGPLIDLPKQLVRHLYTAALARKKGKPFLMEGIGPGPFHRAPSIFTAKRLLKLADFISVRTRESADDMLMEEVECETGTDPAFDYLETRGAALTRLAPGEAAQIASLLDGAEERPVIGVNIRPIYHQYTAGASGDKVSYTRDIEQRFEERLAAAINEVSRRAEAKPVFVFFSMNAVQFGLSDMTSVWRISRHIAPGVDWRVWEADASLDGVLELIRNMTVAVTMRFHATIFALSQGVDAIGIDYRIGKRDKVAAVLSDAGKGDQVARIDEMTTPWLVDQLSRHIRLRD
ncbi:MAG: polysaccharide pyruvyl transferase family protein [Parvularculaceae bacterium]